MDFLDLKMTAGLYTTLTVQVSDPSRRCVCYFGRVGALSGR
jgi:hypothetical protein